MTGREFTGYLKYPENLSRDDRFILRDLVNHFPYCSVARILYTCNLYKENDLEYGSQLKIAAAYAGSRAKMKILFDLVRNPVLHGTIAPDKKITENDKEFRIPLLTKEEIIEKFIREEPTISPPKTAFFNPTDHALYSNQDDEEIVSETLAELFIRQGNIPKAIKIYERLSLLFPEKSVYFAGLIEKLKG